MCSRFHIQTLFTKTLRLPLFLRLRFLYIPLNTSTFLQSFLSFLFYHSQYLPESIFTMPPILFSHSTTAHPLLLIYFTLSSLISPLRLSFFISVQHSFLTEFSLSPHNFFSYFIALFAASTVILPLSVSHRIA